MSFTPFCRLHFCPALGMPYALVMCTLAGVSNGRAPYLKPLSELHHGRSECICWGLLWPCYVSCTQSCTLLMASANARRPIKTPCLSVYWQASFFLVSCLILSRGSDVSCVKRDRCLALNSMLDVVIVVLMYLPFNCNALEGRELMQGHHLKQMHDTKHLAVQDGVLSSAQPIADAH